MTPPTSIETSTGRSFTPLDPIVNDIVIADIAHPLSQQCRFQGHTVDRATGDPLLYSVGEHCVRVSRLIESWGCSRILQLDGLLHDASEAYSQDVASPLKYAPEFSAYRAVERRLMLAIRQRFGLPLVEHERVRIADAVMLATEARDVMPYNPVHWAGLKQKPLTDRIVPWTSIVAKRAFLSRFEELTQ